MSRITSGAFFFEQVRPPEAICFAWSDAWVSEGIEHTDEDLAEGYNPGSLFLRPGESASLTLRVVPAQRVDGVVVDEAGAPVPGADISLSGSRDLRADLLATRTGRDGRFALGGLSPDLTYTLRASKPGFSSGRARGRGALTIRMKSRPRARLRVVDDETGQPLPGTRLSTDPPRFSDVDGLLTVYPRRDSDQAWSLSAEGYLPEKVPRRRSSDATVRLRRGARARVRVRHPDGSIAPGAYVSLDREAELGTTSAAGSQYSGTDGWAILGPLRAGGHRVSVEYFAGRRRWRAHGRVAAGGETEVTLVEGDPLPGDSPEPGEERPPDLAVRVLDAHGKPVPHGYLRIEFQVEDALFAMLNGIDEPWVAEFRDGLWSHGSWDREVLDQAKLRVDVLRAVTRGDAVLPYGHSSLGWVSAAGEYEIRLPQERVLAGRLVGPGDQPVAGALIWAFAPHALPDRQPYRSERAPPAPFVSRTRSRTDGSFLLGGLGNDPVSLVVEPPPHLLPPGAIEARGGGEPLVIRLKPGVEARIKVLDSSGAPVAGAEVFADRSDRWTNAERGMWRNTSGWRGVTGAEGEALLTGLDPGPGPGRFGTLEVRPPRQRPDLGDMRLEAWRPGETDVRLPPSGRITGFVRDSKGRPRPEAQIDARFANGRWRKAEISADGSFLIDSAPPGEVVFEGYITPSQNGILSRAREVTARTGDQGVLIPIEPLHLIRIRVEGWPRGEFESVNAVRRGAEKDEDPVTDYMENDGSLEFAGVQPDGIYDVVIGPVGEGWYARLEGLRAGSEVVSTRMRRGLRVTGRVLAPPGTDEIYVTVGEPFFAAYASVEKDGSFSVDGVPPGRWPVVATAWTADRVVEYKGRAMVEAGSGVEFEVVRDD